MAEDFFAPNQYNNFSGFIHNQRKLTSEGAVNKQFDVDITKFLFDIITDVNEQKTEPINGLVCYSRTIILKTNAVSDSFKIGGYVSFQDKLFILKDVSVNKGGNRKVWQYFNYDPTSTTTMTMESVQE